MINNIYTERYINIYIIFQYIYRRFFINVCFCKGSALWEAWNGMLWNGSFGRMICKARTSNGQWSKNQMECQTKCEADGACVGIGYSHESCIVCNSDDLEYIPSEFVELYRKPGKSK